MALDISQVSIGYDTQGILKYIDDINIQVVQALSDKMDEKLPDLKAEVDKIWVGQSANAFKNKLERDTETMKQTLKKLESTLRGQFGQIVKNVNTYDEAQAEIINSQE